VSFLRFRGGARALLLALSALAAPLHAAVPNPVEPPHPQGELTLSGALAAALRGNPELARYAYDRRAADARALQAGLTPNPELKIDLEDFAGSGERRGLKSMQSTLSLGLVLERSAKREARLSVAREGGTLVDADYALARLDVVATTAKRYIDVVESQAQLEVATRAVDYAAATLSAADKRITAGAASSMERNRARIAQERARLEQEHVEHLLASQRRMLAALWGETEPLFEHAAATLTDLPEVADYAALLDRLRRSPDYARHDLEQRLRLAELTLAKSRAQGDPVLSVGLRGYDDRGDVAAVASLLLPLPWNNRNQGGIAEAQALAERVDVERNAKAISAESTLYEMVQELRHARTQVESLNTVLMPQAEEALMLARRGYANGRFTQLDLIDAQRTRLELERELIAAASDYHRMLAAVERMTTLAAPLAAP
jgi:cobalt-zinc-cadmium efflux system outer membrane protein